MQKETLLSILIEGSPVLKGEFMWGSNYTFLLELEHSAGAIQAVYKPTRGVRRLWDFPSPSLPKREVAAYLVSEALGWELVPPTLYRQDGPFGPGSLQLFIQHDPDYHYFNFSPADRQRLRPTALFDLLINNADRKGSHILIDPQDHIWLIDHGICFHVDDKLRTVIWDFAGEPIPEPLCADLSRLAARLRLPDESAQTEALSGLTADLLSYLSRAEVDALRLRAEYLLTLGHFPAPEPGRRQYPWPPV